MALVNFENVAAAAESLVQVGGKASVRAVIAELGGGSPNAVLPLLNEWKAGRPVVRASDIALDPRIAALIAEQIGTASAQAAKSAEDKAADVQADAEVIAEAGRDAEARAAELEKALELAQGQIVSKIRDLDNLALERVRDDEIAQEKIGTLQIQLQSERERADEAVKTVAKDEVRLQAIPKLEADIQRLAPFEPKAAVLTAQLEDAQAVIAELRQRLATAEKGLSDARETTAVVGREAEQARIGEQSAKVQLEAVTRELDSAKGQLVEAKGEVKEAREELKGLRAQLLDKSKETTPPKA